jgi:hypothetical protein
MTGGFVSLRRISALSVTITILASPIATAQSPDAVPPIAAPANTALLSNAAFARLVQAPPADVAPVPVVKAPPRFDLRQVTALMAKQPLPPPTQAPQRSWMSRHKWTFIIPAIVVGAVFGGYGLWVYTGCGENDCG